MKGFLFLFFPFLVYRFLSLWNAEHLGVDRRGQVNECSWCSNTFHYHHFSLPSFLCYTIYQFEFVHFFAIPHLTLTLSPPLSHTSYILNQQMLDMWTMSFVQPLITMSFKGPRTYKKLNTQMNKNTRKIVRRRCHYGNDYYISSISFHQWKILDKSHYRQMFLKWVLTIGPKVH